MRMSTRKPPGMKLLSELMKQVNEFNHLVNVGDEVEVTLDNGAIRRTTTTTKAEVLGGHSAVVWMDGISGCYLLDRVLPVKG